MKRLIRKADDLTNNEKDQDLQENETNVNTIERIRNEVMEEKQNKNMTNMVMLNELDEADIRHENCPQCKYHPLVRKDGFKVCPSCGMVYKMLDGKGYIVTE